MSNSNVGMMIVVIIALIAIVFVGAYLVMGDFSGSSSENKAQSPESQLSALQLELNNAKATNFELSNQLSAAQSENARLKQQTQLSQTPSATNDRKCSDLDDDYDNTRQDIRDKKSDISDLEDEIAAKQERNETTTYLEDRLSNYEDDLRDLENDLDDIKEDQDRYNC